MDNSGRAVIMKYLRTVTGFIMAVIAVISADNAFSVSVGYDEYDYWQGTRTIRICRKYSYW